MEWSDNGIVISVRKHAESNLVLDVFTQAHGRHAGLVRGGGSSRQKGLLQPGNGVALTWRARLSEHLGIFTIEPLKGRAGTLMQDPLALAGLTAACAIASILPEREAHPGLYEGFELLLDQMEDPDIWPVIFVRWELGLLQEMGFGLDLGQCAVTGGREDLTYISPRTGRAVSREAGEPYRDRLFRLPLFFMGSQAGPVTMDDVTEGLRITGHFLERHLYTAGRGKLPDARVRLMERLSLLSASEKQGVSG